MARKTLLTEAEIRSFMKLANLTPIGDARLQEWAPPIEEEEVPLGEEEEEMALDDAEDDAPPDAPGDMEMDMDIDMPDDGGDMDMDMDADMDAPMGGGDKEDEFMDLVQQLADLVGVDVQMDDGGDMGGEEEMDMDMDMGDDVEAPAGGEDLGDEAALDDEADLDDAGEEEPGMRYMEGSEEDIVNEVSRRVAKRLQQESKKQDMVNQLAERIFNRLASK